MPTAPLPDNEISRLAALHETGLLDSEPEERFDRLTRLARRIFDVPIALISLVDEQRQWFKSRQGLASCETDRRIAFCAHTLLQDDVLEIVDARRDPRFADNPLVTSAPHIRFYAGAQVRNREGYILGTLCLIDTRPRQLSHSERASLRDLADCVEEELSTIDRRTLASVAQQTTNAVVITDQYGRITWVNAGFHRQTGYSLNEVRGRSPGSFLQGSKTNLSTVAEMRKALSRHDSFDVEVLNYHKSGRPLWIHITCNPLLGRSGELEGYVAIQSDIGKIKEAERVKREFTVTISHELRTPLTSLTGALELLDEGVIGQLPDSARRLIGIARKNGQRLRLLINDVLDMEKLLAGEMDFRVEAVPLKQLLEQSISSIQTYAGNRTVPVALDTDCPDLANELDNDLDNDLDIIADPDRFQQIMNNLLSNAIKFSPDRAEVKIRAVRNGARARVEVVDQGPGIPADFQKRLFQPFSQLAASDGQSRSGTGLGLAITREIVEQMKGLIGCESTPGQGALFWFELPLAESATTTHSEV